MQLVGLQSVAGECCSFLAAIPPAMQASKITTGNTEVYLVEQCLKAFLQLYD